MITSTIIRSQLLAALATASLSLPGCMSASSHLADVRDVPGDRLTVGTVQRDLHSGMSGADVVALLGAPNIVTSDEQRREVWVYDKVASEVISSASGLGLSPFILFTGSISGAGSGTISQSAGATARSDRTLTIVINFDGQKRVRDFAYHASQF